MLTMLGSRRKCCDGLTRRETLRAGALTALGGLSLPQLLANEKLRSDIQPRAKNVILLFLLGGAATQDMVDLKPEGPVESRGEFKPIASNVPGIDICEHLPQSSRWMHKTAIVRSLNHKAGCHNCLPIYSGYEVPQPDQNPRQSDPPSMGSVCEFLKDRSNDFPAYVYMPSVLGWGQGIRRSGPYAGFLGKRFDALTTECSPQKGTDVASPLPGNPANVLGTPSMPNSALQDGVTIDRLSTRRSLLQQIDAQLARAEAGVALKTFDRNQQQAFDLLTSSQLRHAFDLAREDPQVVARYGANLFGNSTLIGRRLVEAGVRFVNVTWDLFWGPGGNIDYDAWDTHTQNFKILKNNKLPGFDQTYSALLEDLETRGLLDETLVVVVSEMGRTPRINGNAGRDHWTYCYSMMFAGAGIKGGTVYGASDNQAGYVKDKPVSTADVCATIYHLLGIDPDTTTVTDPVGRPVPIHHGGQPIWDVMV